MHVCIIIIIIIKDGSAVAKPITLSFFKHAEALLSDTMEEDHGDELEGMDTPGSLSASSRFTEE
jgi:hypothetical protein